MQYSAAPRRPSIMDKLELPPQIDASANAGDVVQVQIQPSINGSNKLYVHVNGITILRIGNLKKAQIEVSDER